MTANNRAKIKYIYDLPYSERTELCIILDLNDKWEELGGKYMQFSMMEILALRQEFLRHKSPTDELLTKWGHMNHTVEELFVLLSKMHHYQAMLILKPFVDPRYHRLLHEGEANLSQSFFADKNTASKTDTASKLPSRSLRESQLQNVAGALVSNSQNDEQLLNINKDVGQHNLNVEKSQGRTHLPSNKVDFPDKVEEKILNTAGKEKLPRKLSNVSDASSLGSEWTGIPLISYKELSVATHNWDKHSILGKGGFGTVYKGTWKNTQVAIKKIDLKGREGSAESYQGQVEQSLRELRILNSCRHDNILPVYGYSIGGNEPCLVYQFMINGSLEDRILCRRGSKPLTWLQRHRIAEGTARGLQFMHNNDTPFIHGDIKSANILLDSNWEPRIGDFGLAREGPLGNYTHMKVSKVHGTKPYLPDEYLRSYKLSPKVDTYSFGIVLFELATGLRAYDETRETNKYLKEYVECFHDSHLLVIMDKKGGSDDQHTFLDLINLGKLCVSRFAKDRPEMEIVMKQLEGIASKRDLTRKAHGEIRKLVPSPSTPYERQLFYEQMKSLQPGMHMNGSVSFNTAGMPVEVNNISQSPHSPLFPFQIAHPLNGRPNVPVNQSATPGNSYSVGSYLPIAIPGSTRSLNVSPTSNNASPNPNYSPHPLNPTYPPAIYCSPPSDISRTDSYTTSDDSDDSMPTSNYCEAPPVQVPLDLFQPPEDLENLIPMITELLGQDKTPVQENAAAAAADTADTHTTVAPAAPDVGDTTATAIAAVASSKTPTAVSKTFMFHDND